MNPPPALPVPPGDWLRRMNERYGQQNTPPGQRPFRALEEWARQHGQPVDILLPLGGETWEAIDAFFKKNTKLGQERVQPLGRSAWFYQGSFYQMNFGMFYGGPGPSVKVKAFQFLAENMPELALHDFSRDEPAVQAYLEHLSNALDSFQCSDWILKGLKDQLAGKFLYAAESLLDSAVADLLSTPPNTQAAEHSRVAFEASLKGFLAEKGGLTKKEALRISHNLDQLLNEIDARCAGLIPLADLARLRNAAADSTSPPAARRLFPDVGMRYDPAALPNQRRLSECYASAQHAFATVLRALGASDSRQQTI
jgi:HEPN domain-containing protein